MADATVTNPSWRLVEVGRVVLVQGAHPDAGRLAAIVEIIDHKRVLVEGPSSDAKLAVTRKSIPLADCLLSQLVIKGLPRGVRQTALKKFWESAEIDAKWKQSNWFKRREQIEKRRSLTDFDRFKVLRLKKQRRFEERKALAKVKASA